MSVPVRGENKIEELLLEMQGFSVFGNFKQG